MERRARSAGRYGRRGFDNASAPVARAGEAARSARREGCAARRRYGCRRAGPIYLLHGAGQRADARANPMRWIRDLILLLVLTGVAGGVVWWQSNRREEQARVDKTTADTQRLEREVRYRAATKAGELNARGWPITVDPAWFESDPPRNLVVSDDRPWVEIASEEDMGLQHPAERMTLDEKTAAFWYNPYQGVVRARVPVAMTDDEATALYNAVNRSSITSIHWREVPSETPKLKQDKRADEGDKKDGAEAQATAPKAAATPARKAPERERNTVVVHRPGGVSNRP